MNNLSMKAKLFFLAGVFSVGFLFSSVFLLQTLNQVKVNGPIYQNIVQQKDLLADILPPPEYLLESYLVTQQMLIADKNDLPALVDKSKALLKDFEERHSYWQRELPEGDVKKLLNGAVYQTGKVFLDLQQLQLIPALLQDGQRNGESFRIELAQKYQAHRSSIDNLVTLATQQAETQEKQARELM